MTTTLTNDQITAGAAVLAIPTAILHLPCNRTMSHFATVHEMNSYKEGHRDARHAAADLVLARADELKALAGPSPQIAEVAELPPPAIGYARQWLKCRTCGQVQHYDYIPYSLSNPIRTTVCGHGSGERDMGCDSISEAQARAAIAASRRASTDSQEPVLKFAIEVEKMLCRALGRSWSASGISIETLIAELAERSATPAPASAGQASWAAEEGNRHARIYLAGKAAGLAEGAGQAGQVTMPEQVRNYLMGQDLYLFLTNAQNGIDSPATMQSANRLLVRLDKLRELIAAQPAKDAGQAGQVAVPSVTNESALAAIRHVHEHNGPGRYFEAVEMLVDTTERAAAPADHKIREAVNELRDVAMQFHAHQSLRDRIAAVVLPLVRATHQPSAQVKP